MHLDTAALYGGQGKLCFLLIVFTTAINKHRANYIPQQDLVFWLWANDTVPPIGASSGYRPTHAATTKFIWSA